MIGCDWLTIEDRKSRARTRAVIGHRPRSAGRKAAVNDKTSSALREREREREREIREIKILLLLLLLSLNIHRREKKLGQLE